MAVLNFITATQTLSVPFRRFRGISIARFVRGVFGLIEPTRLSSLNFSHQGVAAISAPVRALAGALHRSTADRHHVVARLQLVEIVGPSLHHLASFDEVRGTVVRTSIRIAHRMR